VGGRDSYNLKKVKTVILDEADEFFADERFSEAITKIANCKDLDIAKP
jgi:superfamily II DNA/RNA helicase